MKPVLKGAHVEESSCGCRMGYLIVALNTVPPLWDTLVHPTLMRFEKEGRTWRGGLKKGESIFMLKLGCDSENRWNCSVAKLLHPIHEQKERGCC